MRLKWKIETFCSEKVEAECSDLIRKTCPTTPIFPSKQIFVKGHTFLQTILFLSRRAAQKHPEGRPLPVTSPSVVALWAWTCQSITGLLQGEHWPSRVAPEQRPKSRTFCSSIFTWQVSPSLPSREQVEPSAPLVLGLRARSQCCAWQGPSGTSTAPTHPQPGWAPLPQAAGDSHLSNLPRQMFGMLIPSKF